MSKKIILVFTAVALAVMCLSAADQAPEPAYRFSPRGGWVVDHRILTPKTIPGDKAPDGFIFLLYDNQRLITARESHQYYRIAKKIVHDKGIDPSSKILIDFDPQYERLIIHDICVRRGNTVIPKLKSGIVNLYQREERMEYRIYDGRKTAHVLLDDIREGDIVEYSYTLTGQNPVLENRYYDSFYCKWSAPIFHMYNRILVSRDREIFIKNHGTDVEPSKKEAGDYNEYLWFFSAMNPVEVESDLPEWYNPYPWVQITDTKKWNDIAQWATRQYKVPALLSRDLSRQVKEISGSASSKEDKVLGALHFVQDKIRYTAIVMGTGAYAPTDPAVVLQRRFGDCKDKTLLLLTLLRGLGVDASAALVNTVKREHVINYLPSPGAFNHVIVHATVGGDEYWLDPTMNHQGGDLKRLVQPDFGYALVVSSETTKLTKMGGGKGAGTSKIVEEFFDLTAGLDKAAGLRVSSTLVGEEADSLRYNLVGRSLADLQKNYLNYYSRYFPGITATKTIGIKDDTSANSINVVETYSIPDFFKHNKEASRREAEFFPYELTNYLSKPNLLKRSMPLAVKHPVHIINKTRVKLPEDWKIETGTSSIRNDIFKVEQSIDYKDRIISIDYDYRSLADYVTPSQLSEYLKDIEKCSQIFTFVIYKSDSSSVSATNDTTDDLGISGNLALVILLFLLLVPPGIIIFRMQSYFLKKNGDDSLDESAAGLTPPGPETSDDIISKSAVATYGKRLANWIIDQVVITVLYLYIWIVIGVLEAMNLVMKDSVDYIFKNFLFILLFQALYYFLFEFFFAKTPAKFFTKTIVEMKNGDKPALRAVIIRSLCRCIPFEIFSFLGSSRPVGWHDSIPKTRVVEDRF